MFPIREYSGEFTEELAEQLAYARVDRI